MGLLKYLKMCWMRWQDDNKYDEMIAQKMQNWGIDFFLSLNDYERAMLELGQECVQMIGGTEEHIFTIEDSKIILKYVEELYHQRCKEKGLE